MSLQLNKTKLIGKWTIAAAAIQGATTGHAYWIDATGALVDAGASIAAANPTNQPPINFDVSQYSDLQWSLFYGAQTSNVGGKIGIAELWPTYPVDVVNTIPPFVRDVASHWLVTAGLGFVVQSPIPENRSVLYDVTSANATALVVTLDTSDFDAIFAGYNAASGNSTFRIDDVTSDGTNQPSGGVLALAAAAGGGVIYQPGAVGVGGTSITAVGRTPGARTLFSIGAATTTVRAVISGERKRPLRKPFRIAPYIQWVNPGTGGAAPAVPTAGSQPIYLQLWGRIADGEVR